MLIILKLLNKDMIKVTINPEIKTIIVEILKLINLFFILTPQLTI